MLFLCMGFHWGLLNLSSVGGRSLKLTDYYRAEPAEARRFLPDRAKTEAEPEAEPRPRQ